VISLDHARTRALPGERALLGDRALPGASALTDHRPPHERPDGAAPLIALVDRRELTRHGLERWLEEAWPGHRVLAVPRVAELGERVRRGLRFAVIGVPAGRVLAAETLAGIGQLRRSLGSRPVIVLAEGEDPAEVAAALRAGARGYLPTTLDRGAATEAIRFVLAGGTFVPAGVIAEGGQGAGAARRPGGAAPRLSPRELEVAGRLREGKPNKIIARELSISESTVKVFVRRILAKLGAANRTEAAFLAKRCLGAPERDAPGPETIAAE
jgi:DNA-binding NarL/FixJ family response regulator